MNRSEVVCIQGPVSSDYVATSYRLDGPGSFPGSILIFSVFSSILLCLLCMCFFCIFCFLCFIMFMYFYLYMCTVLYCGCSCTLWTLPSGISPIAVNNKYNVCIYCVALHLYRVILNYCRSYVAYDFQIGKNKIKLLTEYERKFRKFYYTYNYSIEC
jgi:hypothetical protein